MKTYFNEKHTFPSDQEIEMGLIKNASKKLKEKLMSNLRINLEIVKLENKLEILLEDREKRIEAINSLKRIISDYKATPPFSFDPRNSVGKSIMEDQLFQYEKTLENHQNLLQMEQKTIYNLRNEIMFLQFEKRTPEVRYETDQD
jgi:hypothetical protein